MNSAVPVTILFVDDDEEDFLLARDLLSEISGGNYRMEWTGSFVQAIEIMKQRSHDVYLVDYNLGVNTGFDLVRFAEHHGIRAPFVILTGFGTRELDIEAMKLGVADYLLKGELSAPLLERTIRYAVERHNLLRKLEKLALNDELTGVYNRRGFFSLAEQQLKQARRHEGDLLFIFIDINGLKRINDTFGHDVGDQAIIDTSQLLKETFRDADIIARLGGDEFVCLAVEASRGTENAVVTRLKRSLERFHREHPRDYKLSFSIGVTFFDPDENATIDDALRIADRRMYKHKAGSAEPSESVV